MKLMADEKMNARMIVTLPVTPGGPDFFGYSRKTA
jgi:hypothetical protein